MQPFRAVENLKSSYRRYVETSFPLSNSALQKEFNLFPNPAKTVVTISDKAGIKMKQIVLSNLVGQNVYTDNTVNADKATIDISGFAPGIYNVSIITEKGTVNKKLEVMK